MEMLTVLVENTEKCKKLYEHANETITHIDAGMLCAKMQKNQGFCNVSVQHEYTAYIRYPSIPIALIQNDTHATGRFRWTSGRRSGLSDRRRQHRETLRQRRARHLLQSLALRQVDQRHNQGPGLVYEMVQGLRELFQQHAAHREHVQFICWRWWWKYCTMGLDADNVLHKNCKRHSLQALNILIANPVFPTIEDLNSYIACLYRKIGLKLHSHRHRIINSSILMPSRHAIRRLVQKLFFELISELPRAQEASYSNTNFFSHPRAHPTQFPIARANYFARSSIINLKTHINALHNGVKHACATCGKKFTRKIHLKAHVDSAHNGVTNACDLCEKKFSTKGSYDERIYSDGQLRPLVLTFSIRTNSVCDQPKGGPECVCVCVCGYTAANRPAIVQRTPCTTTISDAIQI
ncbi:unnamed protein product [Trichogramma brassicae]|uniref:C2H2-type domain-containing protein n=1 Tax=Trichogramma brassicae TaxID=86971 RepID=A0A6H5I426_9HYME|nr:unnamed protein product [Trichogramma brassicae]